MQSHMSDVCDDFLISNEHKSVVTLDKSHSAKLSSPKNSKPFFPCHYECALFNSSNNYELLKTWCNKLSFDTVLTTADNISLVGNVSKNKCHQILADKDYAKINTLPGSCAKWIWFSLKWLFA